MIEYCLLVYLTCTDAKCIPPQPRGAVTIVQLLDTSFKNKKACENYYAGDAQSKLHYYGHTCWGKYSAEMSCSGHFKYPLKLDVKHEK